MASRADIARRILADLFADEEPLNDAVVADGWPRAMVREGFAMHRQTWDVDEIVETVEREDRDLDESVVESVAHLWPALPGAGVTPILYGFLAGVPQQFVRSGTRAQNFAQHFLETWRAHDDSVTAAFDDWRSAERIVVSGSDETVATLVDRFGRSRVFGYGHRISLAIVEDDQPERWVDRLATDVVMWHQTGCFSCRGVVFVGSKPEAVRFASDLAEAIAAAEERLGASFDEGQLARRMQALGTAQFETEVFEARHGWVELRDMLRDEERPPHVVPLVRVDEVDDVTGVVTVPTDNIQAVAVAGPRGRRIQLADIADLLGATRCTVPGQLQQPPAAWPHDGAPNLAAFAGEAEGRVQRRKMWIDRATSADTDPT